MIVEPSGPAFCASCCLFPRVSRAQARSGAAAEGPAAGLVLRLDPGGACARFARSILGNRFGIGIATYVAYASTLPLERAHLRTKPHNREREHSETAVTDRILGVTISINNWSRGEW